jgi:hypothetical protein
MHPHKIFNWSNKANFTLVIVYNIIFFSFFVTEYYMYFPNHFDELNNCKILYNNILIIYKQLKLSQYK